MHASTLRRPVAVASALLLAATLAVAGSGHAAGPQGHAGPPHAAGGLVEHVMAGLKDRLALDSSQLQMFETARAGTQAARDQGMAQRQDVRARMEAELAKGEPDLAAIAALFEGVEDQGRAARRQVRDQWLKLYANLRPDQKGIVRDTLRQRVAQMDGMRDHGRQRGQKAPS
jgi:Spy/CpxP family protein refolding chaperone